jgi:hypothetical protein
MKNIEEVTAEIKAILSSKQYLVQCDSLGLCVPETEINRANAHGEAQLRSFSDSDILEIYNNCKIDCDSGACESESLSIDVLTCLAEKGFVSSYDRNILFLVYLW